MLQAQRTKRASSLNADRASRASAESPAQPDISKDWLVSGNIRPAESLTAANELGDRVPEEDRVLQQEARACERDNFEVGECLRQELADRKREDADLTERLAEPRRRAAQQLEELQRQHASERAEKDAAVAETTAALQSRVQELEARLASVAGFREQQGSIAREMQHLRSERNKAKRELAEQARTHAAALQQLREELHGEAEEMAEAVAKENTAGLDAQLDTYSAQLVSDNQRLKAELRVHSEESTRLEADMKEAHGSHKHLQREVNLLQDLEQQYSKRIAAQVQETSAAKREAEVLTAKLRLTDTSYQAQLQALKDEGATERAAAEADIDTLQRALELKGSELKHLRQLSQRHLQQRSDIERFLLSSLDMVQAEIAAGHKVQAAATSARSGVPVQTHIDLADLSWTDREKVLRLLFAQLKHSAQQAFFKKKMPAHIQA